VSFVRRLVPPLLSEPEFRKFWLGQTISVFGDQVTQLALPIVAVLVLGATSSDMGLLTAAGLLPALLFSLPAGVWLDRVHRRRRLMILADLGRAAAITAVPIAWALNALSLPLIYAMSFVAGTLSVLFMIAWSTLFAAVARREDYVSASALLNGSRSLSSVGGPAIGGALIQLLGAPLALLGDALSFLGSAVFLSRIRVPDPPLEHEPGSIRQQLTSGMRFIFGDPIMRPTLLSAATLNFFNFCFAALFILFATRDLGVAPGVLGLALGSGAIGSVIGAVFASRIGKAIGLGRAYILGLVLFPAPLILVPLASGLPAPAILAMLFASEFLAGFGLMILDINVGSMILARVPQRIRSRVSGSFGFINNGIRPIGATVGGLLGAALGVRETLLIVSIAQLAGLLWLIRSPIPSIREMPEPAE
jgi:MFS family permease